MWYQPSLGNRRLLRESHEIVPLSDEVTPPRYRLATSVAAIGSRMAPKSAKPRLPVEMLTSSSL